MSNLALGARQLPLHHISIRVPWHDRGWDGSVCADPKSNTSCLILPRVAKAPNRVFLTADADQSIYGSGFRWADVHEGLKFKGRTGILRANFRSTREIGEAARAYLADGTLEKESVTPE